MATQKEILREFLVQLGFEVNMSASRKFYDALAQTSKGAAAVAAGLAGIATAAEVMVNKYAQSIEKLYYQSKRTNSSVSELKALGFAAEQVGVSAEEASGSIDLIGQALKGYRPDIMALIQGLNVQTSGRSAVQVFRDLVNRLNSMDPMLAAGWGEVFGMSPAMLANMKGHMDDFVKAYQYMLDLQQKSDVDKFAKTWRDYANEVKDVWEQIDIVAREIAQELLPSFKEFTSWLKDKVIPAVREFMSENGLGGIRTMIGYTRDLTNGFAALFDLLEKHTGLNPFAAWARGMQVIIDSVKMVGTLSALIGHGEFAEAARVAKNFVSGTEVVEAMPGKGGAGGAAPTTSGGNAGLFDRIEKAFGLPAGTMDRMWKTESSRGTNMGPSSAGALGHFQFLPETAKKYGVDPYDLTSSATGAGQYLSDLMGKYGGDFRKAVIAYGGGNPMNPSMKAQTYANQVMGSGAQINMTNNFTVHSTDPQGVARESAAAMSRTLADGLRNLQPGVR